MAVNAKTAPGRKGKFTHYNRVMQTYSKEDIKTPNHRGGGAITSSVSFLLPVESYRRERTGGGGCLKVESQGGGSRSETLLYLSSNA